MFWRKKKPALTGDGTRLQRVLTNTEPQAHFKQALWPVIACGAGLFSDGYVNNVIGSVSTTLGYQYGDVYTKSSAASAVPAIAFAGTVVGQLLFGYLSDKWSRKNSLLVSTIILIIFTALAAGSYFNGSVGGMFVMLTIWRFFVGIGIGGEYPAGSVSCAESSNELKEGTRNGWFILSTNCMIDWGFFFGAFIPFLVAVAAKNTHYTIIWRTSLGIGVLFPLVLFFLRLKIKEPRVFSKNSMKHVKTPYRLVFKFYGVRLLMVSTIWFIYDFSAYSFGIYTTTLLTNMYNNTAPLSTVFGWNTLITLLYIPGALLGAPLCDRLGPRNTLILGVGLQAGIGIILGTCYAVLSSPSYIWLFAILYGVFMTFGELGPGNNIGLVAAKSCATGVRGQYYGIAAAAGKVGAFVGAYVFRYIASPDGDVVKSSQYKFYVSSGLCVLACAIASWLPPAGQNSVAKEDARFRAYLESEGWDTGQLGLGDRGQGTA